MTQKAWWSHKNWGTPSEAGSRKKCSPPTDTEIKRRRTIDFIYPLLARLPVTQCPSSPSPFFFDPDPISQLVTHWVRVVIMGHSPKSCNSFHLHVILLVSGEGEKEQTVQHSPLTAREINKKKDRMELLKNISARKELYMAFHSGRILISNHQGA